MKNAIKKKMVKQIQEYLSSNPWTGETFVSYQGEPRGESPASYCIEAIDENPYDATPAVYVIHTYRTIVNATCSDDGIINVEVYYTIQENRGTRTELQAQMGNQFNNISWLAY